MTINLLYRVFISLKKNTIILCSPSRAYYRTDFDVFGLKMTVKEWSMILPRKNWGFQSSSLQKMHLKVLSRKQCVITGFPVLPLYCYKCNSQVKSCSRSSLTVSTREFCLHLFYTICLVCASPKRGRAGEGGGGGEGAVLACNPPSPPPESGGLF